MNRFAHVSRFSNRLPRLTSVAIAGVALAALSLLPVSVMAQRRTPTGGQTVHMPRVREYHVRHLALIFKVNVPDRSCTGTVTHFLSPLDKPLTTVKLDARVNLRIDACKIDGKSVKFDHTGDVLSITPEAPLPVGKEAAVEISYTLPKTQTQGGANGAGGFRWIEPAPGDPDRQTSFWTQGETNTNSSWVPCYDFPNDKCTSETHVTVPDNWTVIGNGAESPATADPANHTLTYHWQMKQPHSTYLLSLVGGPMDVEKAVWRGVPLYYAVPKGKGRFIPGTFGNTPDMLSLFSDTLGVKYAWPKYAQTAVYDFPGGMENVSATTLGLFLSDLRSSYYGSSSINSHELAHQWFGDLVTCKDWGDIWLNESFATFFEMFYMEHLNGLETYQGEVEQNTRSYLGSAARRKRALSTNVYADPDSMFEQGHTYAKGGVILHVLRRELGDRVFFKGIGLYLKKFGYQPVETADLESTLSAYAKRDLKPWFEQWVKKPGHPVLEMNWTYDEAHKEVVATVKQLQDTTDGTPVYNMPITFGLLSADSSNAATSGKSPVVRQKFTINTVSKEFHIPAPTRPAVVLLDPDHDLLRDIKAPKWTNAELAALVRYAPDAVMRNNAARQLVAAGPMDATKAALFVEALKTETGSNLAAYLIDQLAGLEDVKYRPVFEAQLQMKDMKDTARRAAALRALSRFPGTPDIVKVERTLAASDTEQYSVVTAAVKGLGKHKAVNTSLDVFRHQLGSSFSYNSLATTCIDTLGEAKDEAGLPVLLDVATNAKYDNGLRALAIRAIDTIGPGNAAVHTGLVQLINDPTAKVQLAAINVLAYRKDKNAVPALKTFATATQDKDLQEAAEKAVKDIEAP